MKRTLGWMMKDGFQRAVGDVGQQVEIESEIVIFGQKVILSSSGLVVEY